jgi:hypothetical protein
MSFTKIGGPAKKGMKQGPKARAVVLVAEDDFELYRGVILPAGHYQGWEQRIVYSTMPSTRSAPLHYVLEFTPEQLLKLSAYLTDATTGLTIDVTEHVKEAILVLA